MSNRYQIYNDSTLADGRVELKLLDADTNRVKDISIGKNDLSPANKVRVAYVAGRYLNDMKACPMGKTMIVGQDGINNKIAADVNKQRAVVLLNLENKVYSDSYIPLYDIDGTLMVEDTVIGWINSCEDGGSNPYLGANVKNPPKQSIRALGSGSEVRGWFDTNKALGKITHVAVLSGFGDPVTLEPYYNGFSTWLCLARENSYSFAIPPNINGVTGVDEILIYNVSGDTGFYKINLATGVLTDTQLSLTDFNLSSVPSKTGAFKRIDNSRLACVLGSHIYIWQFDDAGNCLTLLDYSVGMISGFAGFFVLADDPDYLYLSYLNTSTNIIYNKINLSDYTRTVVDASDFIGGLPLHWDNDGTNILVLANSGSRYYVANYKTGEMIVTSDLLDVCGNIVGTLAYPGDGFSIFETSFKSDMLFISKPVRYQDIDIDGLQVKMDVTNAESVDYTVNMSTVYLPWISYGNYSNWYNLYKLSSPMDKTPSDTLDLSYSIGYKE